MAAGALWEAIKIAAAWPWNLLMLSVPVPVAILAILVLPLVRLSVRTVRRLFAKRQPPVSLVVPAEPELSETEIGLLRLLARADGAHVHFEDAANHLGTPRLVLQKVCEGLTQRSFIEPENHIVRGLHIALTRRGRDCVIAQGYLH